MKILSIETSCDDTSAAIVEITGKINPRFFILANIVSSQTEIHKQWGGVYPALAKREHQKNLVPTLEKALEEAGILKAQSSKLKTQNHNLKLKTLKEIMAREEVLCEETVKFLEKYEKPDIDFIAVTNGPGLEPCLWQGVNFSKALSFYWELPIIPVNHIKAHILANWLPPVNDNFQIPISKFQIKFPAIALVVSGGHTQIILMKKFGSYQILGETRDDAAGECFDKTARILGLGYPGGPAIAAAAAKCQMSNVKCQIKLPRPMINTKDYDMSFSGLKTAVLYNFKTQPDSVKKDENYLMEMSFEIQQAIIDVLIKKTLKAAKNLNAKSIILGGGVGANEELRKQLAEKIATDFPKINFFVPEPKYCADNAAMAAIAGYFDYLKKPKIKWEEIKADGNMRIN